MVNAIVELHIMNTTVTIDRAGRVVLPKTLRDELRLEAGDTLQLESEGGRVILRPIRSKSPLRKERGVWVFYGGGTLSAGQATEMIADTRKRRNREILGEKP
jgi:AbrB family looped-hinge helix DNA binding protein